MSITSISPFMPLQIPFLKVEFMVNHMCYRNDILFKEIITKVSEEGRTYCKNIVRFYPLKISEYFIKSNSKILFIFHNFYFQKVSSLEYIINEHRYSRNFLRKSSMYEFSFSLFEILNCLSIYLFNNSLFEEESAYQIKNEFKYKPQYDSSEKRYASLLDQFNDDFNGDVLNVVPIGKLLHHKLLPIN